jgi:hypothetical protein
MAPNPSGTSVRAARYLGALLLIAAGAVHLQQYFGAYYRVIPVIGPLFVANFVLGLALGLALLAPIERLGSWAPALAAAGGIAFAAGTITGLQISESGTLFGFHEHGYRLAVILSIVFEGAAIVLLAAYLLGSRRQRRARRHAAQTPRPAMPAPDRQPTYPRQPR